MNTQIVEGGKISLIIGPMFSGKSTSLISHINRCYHQKKKTIMVKFANDNRYSEGDVLVTHDRNEYPAVNCRNIVDIMDTLLEFDVIGFDEGQFYPDIVDSCQNLALQGKHVIVSALSGNFKMEPFDNISRLIAKADKIKHLKAVCHYCKTDASYSLRTIRSEEEVLIGAAEAYQPVCKVCYYKNSPLGANN